mgnify:FL=1
MTRLILAAVAMAVMVVGCSGSSQESTTTSTSSALASSTTLTETTNTTLAVEVIPPELEGWEVKEVRVGDRTLRLAIADNPTLRAQGLMGVTDLGDLDGMLFYWRHVAHGGFWMKDTVIPLDIVWFLEDGTYAGRASMEPCQVDDCPTYTPGEGIDYRLAIEANPGDLDWIDETTIIVYSD